MKKLFLNIYQFFYTLFHIRTYIKWKTYEINLKRGIINKEKEKISVIRQASKLIPEKIKKGKSKYIPFSPMTKAEIKAIILFEFGKKMKILGIKINDDLEFI
jgi:hypothetical protein